MHHTSEAVNITVGESLGVLTAIKEATTLSITNSDKSSIALDSDYHITTATREKIYLEGYCLVLLR